jgi:hypothetical protein
MEPDEYTAQQLLQQKNEQRELEISEILVDVIRLDYKMSKGQLNDVQIGLKLLKIKLKEKLAE